MILRALLESSERVGWDRVALPRGLEGRSMLGRERYIQHKGKILSGHSFVVKNAHLIEAGVRRAPMLKFWSDQWHQDFIPSSRHSPKHNQTEQED